MLFQAAVRIIANYPVFRAALQMPLSRILLLPLLSGICNAALNIIEFAIQLKFAAEPLQKGNMLVLFQADVRIIANYPVFRAALQMPLSRILLLPLLSGICNAALNIIEFAIQLKFAAEPLQKGNMLVLFQAAVRIIANYPVFRAALQMPLSRNLLLPSVGFNAVQRLFVAPFGR